MNKEKFYREISRESKGKFTYGQVREIVELSHLKLRHKIIRGEEVYFNGFGYFGPKMKPAKMVQNFGKPFTIPAHYIPNFTPAKDFKDAVIEKLPVK
jgi:nucleoid DNA-binding protein